MPVPVNVTVWGDEAPVSDRLSVAANEPAAAGLKATYTVQEAAGARTGVQVLI